MKLVEFYDNHNRLRYRLDGPIDDLDEWRRIQEENNSWICHKCGLMYYNVQKFSAHLKLCNTTYQMWFTKYYCNNRIPRCKICGKYCTWSVYHKYYNATCNSAECFSKNSSITASKTVKIYGDQRNPQSWTYDQIIANGYTDRSDPRYNKLLDDHWNFLSEKSKYAARMRHSGGKWGWHSVVENALMEALKLLYPDLEREVYPPGCNGKFRMDGWIPSLNTYIEEDGEFKRDPNNSLYTPDKINYIEYKRNYVSKITGSKVKNIWESDAWWFIDNLDELKRFVESDIDRSDEYSSTTRA